MRWAVDLATADRVVSGVVRRTGHGIAREMQPEMREASGCRGVGESGSLGDEARSTKHEISGSGKMEARRGTGD